MVVGWRRAGMDQLHHAGMDQLPLARALVLVRGSVARMQCGRVQATAAQRAGLGCSHAAACPPAHR